MEEIRKDYKNVMGKPLGKRLFTGPIRKLKETLKLILRHRL
jgi:hypothetical protein